MIDPPEFKLATLSAMTAHKAALNAQTEMNRLAHERDEAVKAALDSGVSAASLAELLGLSRQRIYTMARNADKAN